AGPLLAAWSPYGARGTAREGRRQLRDGGRVARRTRDRTASGSPDHRPPSVREAGGPDARGTLPAPHRTPRGVPDRRSRLAGRASGAHVTARSLSRLSPPPSRSRRPPKHVSVHAITEGGLGSVAFDRAAHVLRLVRSQSAEFLEEAAKNRRATAPSGAGPRGALPNVPAGRGARHVGYRPHPHLPDVLL